MHLFFLKSSTNKKLRPVLTLAGHAVLFCICVFQDLWYPCVLVGRTICRMHLSKPVALNGVHLDPKGGIWRPRGGIWRPRGGIWSRGGIGEELISTSQKISFKILKRCYSEIQFTALRVFDWSYRLRWRTDNSVDSETCCQWDMLVKCIQGHKICRCH